MAGQIQRPGARLDRPGGSRLHRPDSLSHSGWFFDGATFLGMARLTADGWILSLRGIKWFSNWPNGWTEASLVVSGELLLRSQGQAWKISVLTPPRLGNPTAASIRYHDEYLSGERGLQQLTNRWNRIQAVVALLKQKLTARWFDRTLAGWQLGPSNRQPSLQEAAGKPRFPSCTAMPFRRNQDIAPLSGSQFDGTSIIAMQSFRRTSARSGTPARCFGTLKNASIFGGSRTIGTSFGPTGCREVELDLS